MRPQSSYRRKTGTGYLRIDADSYDAVVSTNSRANNDSVYHCEVVIRNNTLLL